METPLKDLIIATSTSCEVDALGSLEKQLIPDKGNLSIEDLEQEWLELASSTLGDDSSSINPFPEKQPEKLLTNVEDLKRFTLYLFERRYGWSEALNDEVKVEYVHGLGSQVTSLNTEEDVKLKGRLNDLLDDFLKWYLCQPLSQPLLESLKYTVTEANNLPVVRNQTMIHVMEWLKVNAHDTTRISDNLDLIKDLMVTGITDIWSAIRNACVARLSPIIEHLKISQMKAFFDALSKICLNKESTWQSVEGAVKALNVIIRRFQWIGFHPSLIGPDSDKDVYYLKFGREELTQLPDFITSNIHSIIFPLLEHPQLSIRENSIKAFSSFLSRCDFKEALSSFQEVVSLLCKGAILEYKSDNIVSSALNDLPHLAVMRPDYKFLDAYHAEGLLGVCIFLVKVRHYLGGKGLIGFLWEGLLGVCIFLVKQISPGYLLPQWPLYFSTFSLYLSHPASTVRQATSAVFKYIVAKDSNNPSLLKLVLQGLCAEWSIDMLLLTQQVNYRSFYKSVVGADSSDHEEKLLPIARRRSSESHDSARENDSTSPSQGLLSKTRRLSIKKVNTLVGSGDQAYTTADGIIARSWEWREGRLFAYELIIKFLIINHIHYLFPSYALPPHKFDGMASTDDTLTTSHQNRMIDSRQGTRSQSHGAATLHKVFQTAKTQLQCSVSSPLNPIKRHYTYFTKQGEQKVSAKLEFLATATSLLNQTKRMDGTQIALGSETAADYRCLHSPLKGNVSERSLDNSSDVELLKHCLCSAKTGTSTEDITVPEWISVVECECLANILKTLLLQTVECLADTRWELRRMGQQTLPLITECIRWYNMYILKSLWDKYLVNETTLICYGSCIALKFSINHAVRLVHFLEQPPASWKDPGACRQIALSIVDVVRDGLANWMRPVHQLIHRPNFDKLTVVAMETVMLAHSCFPHHVPDKSMEELTILNVYKKLFVHAHRDHLLAEQLKSTLDSQPLQIALEGFLNCCLRDDMSETYPQQVEKYTVTETYPWLPHFLRCCDVEHAVGILPILVHHLGYYCEGLDVCRSLIEGIHILLMMTGEYLHKHCQVKPTGDMALNYDLAVMELCNLIKFKTLELPLVRQILDLFYSLSVYVNGTDHLNKVFEVITSRLDLVFAIGSDPSPFRPDSENYGGASSNLVILSNDIPVSPVEVKDDMSDEEDKEPDAVIQESLVLNTSNNSGQTPVMTNATPEGRGLSPATGDVDSESDSDWDSWEDEEEDQTALTCVFAEFLDRIQALYSKRPNGGKYSEFHEELMKSGETEKKLINSLLDKV
uniref:Uncharacterized protein LOC102802136 n=1 Tax=Saccoglossus kowalevskii TaxID=10224 RepID=A0ABM0MYU5_SACKO|nr:PREDICTED: uncharacterized protein LOC102802136 [Saccoglossus kowalevskii]